MNMTGLTRRNFLVGTAGIGAALGIGPLSAQEKAQLRCYYWGSQARITRTKAVIDIYMSQNKEIAVTEEVANGDDYWAKLATQITGGNIADIFQLEQGTLLTYAKRGACRPLDEFIGKSLDLSNFDAPTRQLCVIDGVTYGVPLGVGVFSMVYDTKAFQDAKMPVPKDGYTWQDYADIAVELKKALGRRGYYGAPDASRTDQVFEYWLLQRGKSLFKGNSIGFDANDAAEWFQYWGDLRARGGCVPPDIASIDSNTIDTMPLGTGKAATGIISSNQLVGFQQINKNKLDITKIPSGGPGAQPGYYLRPLLIFSVGATSKLPDAAVKFINFFVNDVEAGKKLVFERGVSPSQKVLAEISPTVDETQRAMVDFITSLRGTFGPYPGLWPKNAVEFRQSCLRPTADRVAFGELSTSEGGKELVRLGTEVMTRT